MIKLVALDIDGTLVSPNQDVSKKTISAINRVRENGVKIALVSGRTPWGVDSIAQIIGGNVYRISCLGAIIQDQTKNTLFYQSINPNIVMDIANYADSNQISLSLIVDNVEYQTQHQEWNSSVPRTIIKSATDLLTSKSSTTLLGAFDNYSASKLYEYCTEYHADSVYVTKHFERDEKYTYTLVTDFNARKGIALAYLCTTLNIVSQNVLAIGDSDNDISMLEFAYNSVAVSNANQHIKSIAKFIAPYGYSDGVEWALNNFIP